MGVVFEYGGQSYVNIHGNRKHYTGGIIPQQKQASEFSKIKSRYLTAVLSQVQSAQGRTNKRYLKKLINTSTGAEKEMAELEQGIEEELTRQYDAAVGSLGGSASVMDDYSHLASQITKAFKNVEKTYNGGGNVAQAASQAGVVLDQLIELVERYSDSVGLFLRFEQAPNDPAVVTLTQLLGYASLRQVLDDLSIGANVKEDGSAKDLGKQLVTLLAQPAEFLATFIDAFAINKIESLSEFAELMQSRMIGRKSVTVDFLSHQMRAKAADYQGGSRRVRTQTHTDSERGVINHYFNISPFASVKAYRSSKPNLGMVSSESKSLLLDMIKEIYGSQYDYQIYNSLAFKSKVGSTVLDSTLDENFRIIRSDITATFAEKFIIGFNDAQAQQILVYNFQAYPMIYIIDAIIEDAMSKANRPYGSLDSGDLFTVSFATVGNEWELLRKGETPADAKMRRIAKVYTALSGIEVQGKFKREVLEAMLYSKIGTLQGIPI